MTKNELTRELMLLPPDETTTLKCSKGLIFARPTRQYYIKNNVCPCRECVFGFDAASRGSNAATCPHRTACFAHTRPDKVSVIFINYKSRLK
jgi:hypothetical protein|nr:MAG TPA: hypothetical protein [Caudoviricetes sp.]